MSGTQKSPECFCCITRRQFISTTAAGSIGMMAAPFLFLQTAYAVAASKFTDATGMRMAAAEGSFYRAYRTKPLASPTAITWVQIDLGDSVPMDVVKLYPSKTHVLSGDGFPLRFRIECSDDPNFQSTQLIADRSTVDYPDPIDQIVKFSTNKTKGRYVRVTATKLRPSKVPSIFSMLPKSVADPIQKSVEASHTFSLAKIEVLYRESDLALRKPVTVDPVHGNSIDAGQLTRVVRPQGEGLVTDNVKNVTSPKQWRRVAYKAEPPLRSSDSQVRLQIQNGLFQNALQNNIRYLLDSYSLDDLLKPFRQRAGRPLPSPPRPSDIFELFWVDDLAGSNAGRFLMGAANTSHWIDDPELHGRVNAVVEGIAECRQPNGYIMAYPEDTFFVSERGAYTRSWLTHGLIEAGNAGNEKAFELLRSYYDWYNSRSFLSQALRGCIQGGQGMVANSRMYFTPVGKPEDIQILQRYFQEDYWMRDLAARQPDAIWQYPYDRPHVYLLTNLEAYLDLYRATGDQRYLDAVLGGWDLFVDNWQTAGGSFSIIELKQNKPKSYPLYELLGETCGSAFWIQLNHRLHLLMPEEEKYIAQIEMSIYNVLLANQDHASGFRYHTMLVGRKERSTHNNTCCEGQGTRLIASLPQYIYSITADGVYVNLFEASTLSWQQSGVEVRLEMQTTFPKSPAVRLGVHPSSPVHAKLRIRTPSWASGEMSIEVNGVHVASGTPGRYVTLDRQWTAGDEISFTLPIALKLTKYLGADQIADRERFSLTYGPILMAAVGEAIDTELIVQQATSPMALPEQLQPVKDQPLHFELNSFGGNTIFVPYFEIQNETFSCVPLIKSKETLL